MKPARVQVMDIATGKNLFFGAVDNVLLHSTGDVSIARWGIFQGLLGRNGWYQYGKSRVLVLFWP